MSFIIEACKRQSRLVWGRRRIVFVESQTRDHDHGQSDAQDCLLLKIRMAVHRLEASVACLTVIFISYKTLEEIFDDEGRVWIPVKRTVSSVSRGPSVSLNFGVFGTDDKLRF
jgi:hypothetical protein